MGYIEDNRDAIVRSGAVNNTLPDNVDRALEAIRNNKNNDPTLYNFYDPEVDLIWGQIQEDSIAPHQYYDYYFSGEDVQIRIDGADLDWPYNNMPVYSMQWNIAQQKQPVYGFWSYTYDAVMRGSRVVEGTFTVFTRSPNYMTNTLKAAAAVRANRALSNRGSSAQSVDEQNLTTYWGKNTVGNGGRTGVGSDVSLYLVHPPFNFYVIYGVQSQSVGNVSSQRVGKRKFTYGTDNLLYQDINERFVKSEAFGGYPTTYVLESCEITGMTKLYQNDVICMEQYSFFARDLLLSDK